MCSATLADLPTVIDPVLRHAQILHLGRLPELSMRPFRLQARLEEAPSRVDAGHDPGFDWRRPVPDTASWDTVWAVSWIKNAGSRVRMPPVPLGVAIERADDDRPVVGIWTEEGR